MFFYEDDNGNTIPVGPLKGASSGDVYRVCIPLMVLTTLSVALRVYVRGYMTRNFGIEDWLIIPAYVRDLFRRCTQSLLTSLDLVHGTLYMCDCRWPLDGKYRYRRALP